MERHIKLFEEFVNESTTDGTIENLIDATKIAMNMGVFDDTLLQDVKSDFISGVKGSLKTETGKVPQDRKKEFQKFMDSLIMPLDKAKTMSQFLSALKTIAVTKNNILKRLNIQESLTEGKISDFLKDLKSKGADWLETNKKKLIDSIVSTLISWITGISRDVAKSLINVNESKVLNLKNVEKLLKNNKHVSNVEISQGNKLTGVKELTINTDWAGAIQVDSSGKIWTNDVLQTWGGNVKNTKELEDFIKTISMEMKKNANESSLNENRGRDEAQKIIQKLRSRVFKSLSDDELDEFKKEMALALDL